jgi:hypothetical protein
VTIGIAVFIVDLPFETDEIMASRFIRWCTASEIWSRGFRSILLGGL